MLGNIGSIQSGDCCSEEGQYTKARSCSDIRTFEHVLPGGLTSMSSVCKVVLMGHGARKRNGTHCDVLVAREPIPSRLTGDLALYLLTAIQACSNGRL